MAGSRDPNRTVLSEIEQRMLALKIAEPKLTHREMAERLGCARQWVTECLGRDPLRRAVDEHLQDVVETAKEFAVSSLVKAFGRLVDLIDNGESDFVKLRAARDLILIMQKRGDDRDVGEETWEALIGQYGQVRIEKVKSDATAIVEDGDNGREPN
jgi:hypothetical protein